MKGRFLLGVVLASALFGFILSALSTYDFVRHLDRELHAVHCGWSDVAGAGGALESGCKTAMMSPYSSVFRGTLWGGIPIALPAMAVFAFIIYLAVDLWLTGRHRRAGGAGLLVLASAVPVAASLVMGLIALFAVGRACTICIGMYVASAGCGGAAVALWRRRVRPRGWDAASAPWRSAEPWAEDPAQGGGAHASWPHGAAPAVGGAERIPGVPAWATDDLPQHFGAGSAGASEEPSFGGPDEESLPAAQASPSEAAPLRRYAAAMAGLLLFFVLAVVLAYLAAVPSYARYAAGCGELMTTKDPRGVLVPLQEGSPGGAPVIEVIDPLCPACATLEERLTGSDLAEQMNRRLLLFPLDAACNWMIEETLHPGACLVSKAVLCAGEEAEQVIGWAFEHHDRIRATAQEDDIQLRRLLFGRFGTLRGCIDAPRTRARLNASLRWAVKNQLPISTPQLYVDGIRLCDADLDIGLPYTLSRMLKNSARHQERTQ